MILCYLHVVLLCSKTLTCSFFNLPLPQHLRQIPTISSFKREISNYMFHSNIVSSYFFFEARYLSVIHARLRNNCSDLTNDLFLNHIFYENRCSLCNECEDAEHFFFKCSIYQQYRGDNSYLIL